MRNEIVENAVEGDELVRHMVVLETLIRKYASLTEYAPSEYEWGGLTYRQTPTISSEVDQAKLTQIEEKVLRQTLGYESLKSLDWVTAE